MKVLLIYNPNRALSADPIEITVINDDRVATTIARIEQMGFLAQARSVSTIEEVMEYLAEVRDEDRA